MQLDEVTYYDIDPDEVEGLVDRRDDEFPWVVVNPVWVALSEAAWRRLCRPRKSAKHPGLQAWNEAYDSWMRSPSGRECVVVRELQRLVGSRIERRDGVYVTRYQRVPSHRECYEACRATHLVDTKRWEECRVELRKSEG